MTTHQAPHSLLLCPPCLACPSQCRQPPTRRRAAKTAAPRRTKLLSSSGPPPPPSPAGDAWVPPHHTAQPHGPWGHEWPARNWVSSARSLCQCKMSAPPGLSAIPRDTSVLMGARCVYVMLPQLVRCSGGFFKETKIVERELSKAAQNGFAELCARQLL